jgi:hypothetical protein
MNTTLKYILISLVILGIIAIVAFSNILEGIEVGAIIASITGGYAVFKSKLFGSSSTMDNQIALVEQEHNIKRGEWKTLRDEFESKYNALKARMDYIDYKSARILQEISDLDENQKKAIKKDLRSSSNELLDFLNQ